jgi:hypothetical protein
MADDDIFTEETPSVDPNKNYLEELVGPGKKFASVEDLAKGKYQADLYIGTVLKQKDDLSKDYLALREEYNARAKLEELLDQMRGQQASSELPTANDAIESPPQLDLKKVEDLVVSKLQESERLKKQRENLELVKSKLKEQYGSDYTTHLKRHTEDLGLDEAFVQDLAKNHPNVLFKTLGLGERRPDGFQAPPQTQRRGDSFAPSTPKRTWAYYQNLKKTDPKTYLNPKTQVQMHEDYLKLGKEFEDGDFSHI